MKNKINKRIPTPDLRRILILIVYSSVLFVATLATWYYFVVIIPMQEAEAQKKHLETVDEMYRAKYCNKLPYANDAIERLCTDATSPLNRK